jgi:hypothetical protein
MCTIGNIWRVLAAALLGCVLPAAAGERLLTESWDITIDVRCPEGVVGCKDVRYAGLHRKTGKTLKLSGEEIHTLCADKVTPCRFLGYVFRHGRQRYYVWENGTLAVRQGDKLLLQEDGKWQ